MREQRIKFLADESCDFTANMRSELGKAVSCLVAEHGSNLVKSFTVLEPGRARIRKQK